MRTQSLRFICVGLMMTTWTSTASAQLVNSPRGQAMAGVRGDPVASSALFYNPAGMSRSYLYSTEFGYFRAGPSDVNAVSVSVVDSKTQPQLATGLSYGFHFSDDGADIDESGHDVRLGFAHPAIQDRFNLGVTLRYLALERTVDKNTESFPEGFTMDFGALISASSEFHIGLTAHNIIDLDNPNVRRRAGGGIAYTGASITLDVDGLVDFSSDLESPQPVIAAGLEFLAAGSVPIRAGFTHDGAVDQNWVSGGLGFMTGENVNGGQFSVTFRQNIDDTEQFDVGIGLTLFI